MFNTLLYEPLYNALVFLVGVMPGADMGFAVILLTIIVKLALTPLQHKQIKSQAELRKIQPLAEEIKEKVKDKAEQSRQILELYREHKINPLAGLLPLIIQIPIIIALFFVFRNGISESVESLYSFISLPGDINSNFLGIVDLTARSVVLAALVGASQYFQIHFSMPPVPKKDPNKAPSFQADFARSMNLNMRYVMPVFIAIIAVSFPAVLSLYWLTSNLFMIAHELLVKRRMLEEEEPKASEAV